MYCSTSFHPERMRMFQVVPFVTKRVPSRSALFIIIASIVAVGVAVDLSCGSVSLVTPNAAYSLRGCDPDGLLLPSTIRIDADNVSLTVFNSSVAQTTFVGGADGARRNVSVRFLQCLLVGSVDVLSADVAAVHNTTIAVEDSRVHLRLSTFKALVDVSAASENLHVRILRTTAVITATGSTGSVSMVRLLGVTQSSSVWIVNGTIDSNWTMIDSTTPFGPLSNTYAIYTTGGGHRLDVAVVGVVITMEMGYTTTVVWVSDLLHTHFTMRLEGCRIGSVLRGPRGVVQQSVFPLVLRRGILVVCASGGAGSSLTLVDTTATVKIWHLSQKRDPNTASTAVVDAAHAQLVSVFAEGTFLLIRRCRLDISVPESTGGTVGMMAINLFGLVTVYPDDVTTPAVLHADGLHIVVEDSHVASRYAPLSMCANEQTTTVEVSPGTTYPIKTTTNGIAVAQGLVMVAVALSNVRIDIRRSTNDVAAPPLLYRCPHDRGTVFGFSIPNLRPGNYTITAALLLGSINSIIGRIASAMLVVSPMRSAVDAVAEPYNDFTNVTASMAHVAAAMNTTAQPMVRGGDAVNSSLVWSLVWMINARCSGVRYRLTDVMPLGDATATTGPLALYLDTVVLNNTAQHGGGGGGAGDGLADSSALSIHVERMSMAVGPTATATPAASDVAVHLPGVALFENTVAMDPNASSAVVRVVSVTDAAVDAGMVLLRNVSAPINWTFLDVAWRRHAHPSPPASHRMDDVAAAPLVNNAAPGFPTMGMPPWPPASYFNARCIAFDGVEIVNVSHLFNSALGGAVASSGTQLHVPCATPTASRSMDGATASASDSRTAYSPDPSESLEPPVTSTLLPNISFLASYPVPRSPPATIVAAVFTWVSPLARVSAPALQRSMGTLRLASRCTAIRPPSPPSPHDANRGGGGDDGADAGLMDDPLDNPMQFSWPSAFVSPQLSAVGGGVVGNALFCVLWTAAAALLSTWWTYRATKKMAALETVVNELPVTLLDVYAPLLQPCVAGGVGALALSAMAGDVVLGVGAMLLWGLPTAVLAVLLLWTFRGGGGGTAAGAPRGSLCPFRFRRAVVAAPVPLTAQLPATSARIADCMVPPAVRATVLRALQFDTTISLDASVLRRRPHGVRRAAVMLRHILVNYAPARFQFVLVELGVAVLCGALTGAAWFADTPEACTHTTHAMCACLWAYAIAIGVLTPYGSLLVNAQAVLVEGLGAISATCAVAGDDDAAMAVAVVQLVVCFAGSIANWLRWLFARPAVQGSDDDVEGSAPVRTSGASSDQAGRRRGPPGSRRALLLAPQVPATLRCAPEDWHRLKMALLRNAAARTTATSVVVPARGNASPVDSSADAVVRAHAMLEVLIRIAADLRHQPSDDGLYDS